MSIIHFKTDLIFLSSTYSCYKYTPKKMERKIFLPSILYCMITIISVVYSLNITCDYSFGDETWNYSKVFYNQIHQVPVGSLEYHVTLPKDENSMISFVCVNAANNEKKFTKVNFVSIFSRLELHFLKPTANVVYASVLAMQHSY